MNNRVAQLHGIYSIPEAARSMGQAGRNARLTFTSSATFSSSVSWPDVDIIVPYAYTISLVSTSITRKYKVAKPQVDFGGGGGPSSSLGPTRA